MQLKQLKQVQNFHQKKDTCSRNKQQIASFRNFYKKVQLLLPLLQYTKFRFASDI